LEIYKNSRPPKKKTQRRKKKEEEEEERMKMIKESNYMYVLKIRTTQLYSHVTSSSLKQPQHQPQQEAAPHMGSDIKEERERERERGRGRERNTSPAAGQ
jgi:23S rRNA pseudoU1915 N3-methylase RlmH